MPSTERGLLGVVVLMPSLRLLSRRMPSARAFDPSGVVENTSRPGMSLVPGVPSTEDEIDAPEMKSAPSAPRKIMDPRTSADCTRAFVPTEAPRLLKILNCEPPALLE